jgi:uncharacterized oligopeptide transporter (OPT) family protein
MNNSPSRVTGETDVTPTKALGPVTQLIYGGVLPGNVTANVMSANVTGGVGLHAADLLTDLKSGFLLGPNPGNSSTRSSSGSWPAQRSSSPPST